MDEFSLIDDVVSIIGARAEGRWVSIGPGDDSAVIDVSANHQMVSSVDTLVSDVHFPADMPGEMVGYRALMVSLSDIAAMAATPRYVLVAMTLPEVDEDWVAACARGMTQAAEKCDVYICGGNFARGDLSITVSAHGEVPAGTAVTRAGARPGDGIFVSGELGGAAACVREGQFDLTGSLSKTQVRYARPVARVDLCDVVRESAHAAIDISDGLLQDLAHVCRASSVQALVNSSLLPVCPGAQLTDALTGGDDYELLCAAPVSLPGFVRIGQFCDGSGVLVDDEPAASEGYQHFRA